MPKLLGDPGLQLLEPQPLLGAQHLVAVHGVGQLLQLTGSSRTLLRTSVSAASRSVRGPAAASRSLAARRSETLDPLQRAARRRAPRRRRLSTAARRRLARARPDRGPRARRAPPGAAPRPCPAAARGPFLGGAQRQPGVHLLPAGHGSASAASSRSAVSGSSSSGCSLATAAAAPPARPACASCSSRPARPWPAAGRALHLGLRRRARPGLHPAQPLGGPGVAGPWPR